MRTELIIQASESDAVIALLKDGRLTELIQEDAKQQFSVGDVYLGQVRKLAPSLNAAFVDVGYEKDAFLHYHDLGPQISSWQSFNKKVHLGKQPANIADFNLEPLIEKDGAMESVLKPGDQILVQVVKEPISTKALGLHLKYLSRDGSSFWCRLPPAFQYLRRFESVKRRNDCASSFNRFALMALV